MKSTRPNNMDALRIVLPGLLLGIAGMLWTAPGVTAAPVHHGSFSGTTVDFTDVTEDSGTDPPPLFGSPTVAGNTLDFSPVSFNAFSQDGVPDITDGTLTFGVDAKQGQSVNLIRFLEAGDYTLLGLGGQETFASVNTPVFVDILAVDGVGIDPIKAQRNLAFQPNDGKYDLTQFGGGPQGQGVWNGALDVDILDILADAGLDPDARATRVSVTLDNTLTALSKSGTSALIAKKDSSGIVIIVNPEVPEPATVLMMLLGVAGMLAVRRGRG